MAELRLHPRARIDIDAIWNFLVHREGRRHARRYVTRLVEVCHSLAETPEQGTRRDDLADGLRAYVAGQHHVYYNAQSVGIDVVRVLPERMDVVRHGQINL